MLTAEANCSSVMSSTKTGRAIGSSGSASAEPIISKVIPLKHSKNSNEYLKTVISTQNLKLFTYFSYFPKNKQSLSLSLTEAILHYCDVPHIYQVPIENNSTELSMLDVSTETSGEAGELAWQVLG